MNRISLQTGVKIYFSLMSSNPIRGNDMPDYSACSNAKCPKKYECARFLMLWSKRQSVRDYKWDEEEDCSGFWNTKDGAPFKYSRVAVSKSEYKRLKLQGVEVILKEG